MTTTPLPLSTNYNPDTHMLARTTEFGTFHESRRAARFAADLVANGTPDDLSLAERVLDAALACQERDSRDPHVGNFYWMREDEVVADLNAVEFMLEALIPMLLRHGERLPTATQRRVRETIALGLAEIERLDVLVAYTNITVLDVLNSCLGGELLGDERMARRGQQKLLSWIAYTNGSGHPREYNSPTYTHVTLRALKTLTDLVQHEPTRLRARTLAARLAMSVALHIHGDGESGTGRWAGPHSRAYHPTVVGETPPEIELLQTWIADGTVPEWIADLLAARPNLLQVTETAERQRQLGFTTYQTPSFALGTATQHVSPQSNSCMLHYRRPNVEKSGVFYTRYLVDDKWFGDSYHATDRTQSRNLLDEGSFWSVQEGGRALCLYAPSPGMAHCRSAKAALIWTDVDQIDEIWLGDQRVKQLPCDVPSGATVVVSSGDAHVAVRPLHITALGRGAAVRLAARGGDLVLELVNYEGSEKDFWELRWPGAFYQGRPFCAFYLEVAERGEYADGATLARTIALGKLDERLDPPFTYAAEGERVYAVSHARDGRALGLEIDTMAWQLRRRWTQAGDVGWPMLESPLAVQSAGGHIELAGATLAWETNATDVPRPAWLLALPQTDTWVVGYTGLQPTTLRLTTPSGSLTVREMGMGTVVWRGGEVTVAAVGEPQIERSTSV